MRDDIELAFSQVWRGGMLEHLEADGSWRSLGRAGERRVMEPGLLAPMSPEFFRVVR